MGREAEGEADEPDGFGLMEWVWVGMCRIIVGWVGVG